MSAGVPQIDDRVLRELLKLSPGAWLTARELSERTMLSLESAARSLARLVERGLAEGNDARPRGYRGVAFDLDVPPEYVLLRDDEPLRMLSPRRYPDGTRVQVFILGVEGDRRISDRGETLLRLEAGEPDQGLRIQVEELARSRGFLLRDGALVGVPSLGGIDGLAALSAALVVRFLVR